MSRILKKQNALAINRLKIEAAFNELLSIAINMDLHLTRCEKARITQRPDEVTVLSYFFILLPILEEHLNNVLKHDNLKIEIKGTFCHKSGKLGPVVDFDVPPGKRGCELSDLLFLVTHESADGKLSLGNACFLQAKVDRKDINKGPSSERQKQLYCEAKKFCFKNPELYVLAAPDNPKKPGLREIPQIDRSGFAFWCYNPLSFRYQCNHASAVILPPSIKTAENDIGFGNAIFQLMQGTLGKQVAPLNRDDFGWDRIVHDVILRAINEPLGSPKRIRRLRDLPRHIPTWKMAEWLMNTPDTTFIMNPFKKLAESFKSDAMKEAANKHAARKESAIQENSFNDGPPPPVKEQKGDDSGSSGSFIQINVSTDNKISAN